MNRATVDSSNVHSIGHDETGLEVQFHRAGCARTVKPPKGETIQAGCNCIGGDVWHYPMDSEHAKEAHFQITKSHSPGAVFHKLVKARRHVLTGDLLYPGVKR